MFGIYNPGNHVTNNKLLKCDTRTNPLSGLLKAPKTEVFVLSGTGMENIVTARKEIGLSYSESLAKNSFTQNINLRSSDIAAYNTQQTQDVNKLQYPHFTFKS